MRSGVPADNRVRLKLVTFFVFVALVAFGCQPGAEFASGGPSSVLSGSGGEYVQNGDFESFSSNGSDLPLAWSQNVGKTGNKGKIRLLGDQRNSGATALKITPNKENDKKLPLALAQEIPTAGLHGKEIIFSGYIATEGGSNALIGLMNVVRGKQGEFSMIFQGPTSGDWRYQEKTYRVPDDPDVKLYLSVWVPGTSGAAWFDDISVRLATDGPPAQRNEMTMPPEVDGNEVLPTADGPVLGAVVKVDAGQVVRQIPRTLFGANVEWRWNATSLWQESKQRVDPQAQKLTREMGVSIIRYPGGIYSDYYRWRDGIGPYDQRPQVKHEPGKDDQSRPNFGTDEALKFADDIGAELLITVNIVTGTAKEAADWVRYVNKDRLRVRYWEIGNEQYIKSNSPVSLAATMKPADYARKVREFAKVMKAADQRIKIGIIGGLNEGSYKQMDYARWNEVVIGAVGKYADFISVHNAYAPILTGDEKRRTLRDVYTAMMARPAGIARNLDRMSRQLERLYPDKNARPFIAVTEWGPIFQFFHAGQYVDHPKTLGSALFVASTLKTFVESKATDLAAFWMLNDFSVLGWIASANDDFPPNPQWVPTARYYAFQMFSRHFGNQLIISDITSPASNTRKVGWSDAEKNLPYLDVVASLGDDGEHLYILAINRHFESAIKTEIGIENFVPKQKGVRWLLSGTGIDANTGTKVIKVPGLKWGQQKVDGQQGRFDSGSMNEVRLDSIEIDGFEANFSHTFPPHSVTSLVLTRK